MKKQLLIFASLAVISGCAVNPSGQVVPDSKVFNKQRVIPLGAGVLSAVLCRELFKGHGSRDGWTAACGAAGYFGSASFLGNHSQALEKNKVGQTSRWVNPDGETYTVTPTATYDAKGIPCREFRQTVEINGQVEILTGKACRQPNGEWKLIN